MAKIEIKVKGIEALQKRLLQKKEMVQNRLNMELLQLAEEAVIYSKDNKGYKDRTANLKNSISFALYHDGKQITKSIGEGYNATYKDEHNKIQNNPRTKGDVMQMRSNALEEYARKQGVVATSGYSLIIVAGMSYAKHVEDKGHNVLYLTRHFLYEEMKKIFENIKEDIMEL
ncbi:hypothetical protein [uncultured Eubacterium sp.]|uniref:hypothetical protein n=1 Tax=uncultured Eubacterium sp. TaxID=165185 RepID=UPI0025960D0C|nr:hypothetical protein [uncultured Eubacterium sp.]